MWFKLMIQVYTVFQIYLETNFRVLILRPKQTYFTVQHGSRNALFKHKLPFCVCVFLLDSTHFCVFSTYLTDILHDAFNYTYLCKEELKLLRKCTFRKWRLLKAENRKKRVFSWNDKKPAVLKNTLGATMF